MSAASSRTIPVESKLKIFLSIDIVGSTAFKNERTQLDHAHGDHWTRPFLSFYRMSVASMASHWETVKEQMLSAGDSGGHFKFGDTPSFWKGAGDEVLFSKTVQSPLDVMASVQSMLLLMQSHRERFRSKPHTSRLDVKGTAWLAGFPLNNSEIVLTEDVTIDTSSGDDVLDNFKLLASLGGKDGSGYRADYIGPSVDLGFRLRDHASARRLLVSADLVWLLCQAIRKCNPAQVERCKLLELPRINYGSSIPLKGVLDGAPYPLFWIEATPATTLDLAEDALLGRADFPGRRDHTDLLRTYCDTFLDGTHLLKMAPYIPNCGDPDVSKMSPDRQERLLKLQRYVNGSAEQMENLEKSDVVSGGIPSAAEDFANTVATTAPSSDNNV